MDKKLAAALTVGVILGVGGASAQKSTVKGSVNLDAIELRAVNFGFTADGGCEGSVSSVYHPADGDLAPQPKVGSHAYDGRRCADLRSFAAKAAALDYAHDNGKP